MFLLPKKKKKREREREQKGNEKKAITVGCDGSVN